MVDTMISSMPFITSKKIQRAGVTGKTRSPACRRADGGEQGYPGFEAVAWIGMLAPAKTPPEIVAKLNADVKKILEIAGREGPPGGARLQRRMAEARGLRRYMKNEVQKWGAIVKSANVKVE
jgi:tripartite-type tricarboxylate transporter receptor subunit TctC